MHAQTFIYTMALFDVKCHFALVHFLLVHTLNHLKQLTQHSCYRIPYSVRSNKCALIYLRMNRLFSVCFIFFPICKCWYLYKAESYCQRKSYIFYEQILYIHKILGKPKQGTRNWENIKSKLYIFPMEFVFLPKFV